MARILNREQPVRVRALAPKAVYARQVSLVIPVLGGAGPVYKATQVVGNRVWLHHIKVFHLPKARDDTRMVAFNLWTGQSELRAGADLVSWDQIMPIVDINNAPTVWLLHDGREQLEWDMAMYFTGENRRFALSAQRLGDTATDGVYVSFLISEG